jgi:hypothetical protein
MSARAREHKLLVTHLHATPRHAAANAHAGRWTW